MASANRPRTITPTSPSPSPSPRQPHAPLPFTNAAAAHSSKAAANPDAARPDTAAAPPNRDEIARIKLETSVRAIVDHLYQLAVVAAETQPGSEHLVGQKINDTVRALSQLDATKTELAAMIPEDVIDMLDAGRNPDVHTRNFVQRLAAENQYSYGQHGAMEEYNAKLTAALDQAFPQLAMDPTAD